MSRAKSWSRFRRGTRCIRFATSARTSSRWKPLNLAQRLTASRGKRESLPPSEKIDKQTWRSFMRSRDDHGSLRNLLGRAGSVCHATESGARLHQSGDDFDVCAGAPLGERSCIWSCRMFLRLERRGAGNSANLGRWAASRVFSSDFPDYDALADAPIEAGKFEEFQLEGMKPEIWVVVHGDN